MGNIALQIEKSIKQWIKITGYKNNTRNKYLK